MIRKITHCTVRTVVTALILGGALTACNKASNGLTESSRCSDWNTANVNVRGTYLQAEYKKIPHLNAYTGYANGGITQYCGDAPAASLGDITRKVASS